MGFPIAAQKSEYSFNVLSFYSLTEAEYLGGRWHTFNSHSISSWLNLNHGFLGVGGDTRFGGVVGHSGGVSFKIYSAAS